MGRSLKSKRRRKNLQVLRERYKPRYDAQLQSIVANMQNETDELMETAGDIDLDGNVQIIDPDDPNHMEEENSTEKKDNDNDENEKKKIKLTKVDVEKVVKFMSQRKFRKYKRSVKRKNKSLNKNNKPKRVIGDKKEAKQSKIQW